MGSTIFSRISPLIYRSPREILPSIAITLVCVACDITAPNGSQLTIDSRTVVIAPGDTVTIGLTLRDGGVNYRTTPQNPSPWPATEAIEWASSDVTVATVAASGRITGLKAGRSLLSARAAGKEVTAIVDVRSAEPAPPVRYRKIAAGDVFTCGLSTTGKIYCWGSNWLGTLGSGFAQPFTASYAPVPVASSETFSDLDVGGHHACALAGDGRAFCWGSNSYGERGSGGAEPSGAPSPVNTAARFTTIGAGNSLSCGLTSAGQAYCWGQRGSRKSADPVSIGGPSFTTLAVGGAHACGLTVGGAAYCWGATGSDQIGTGTTDDASVPRPVAGSLTFSALSAGIAHTCGVATSGEAYCWGTGLFGRLGTGSDANAPVPTRVNTTVRLASIGAGSFHTCAVSVAGGRLLLGT